VTPGAIPRRRRVRLLEMPFPRLTLPALALAAVARLALLVRPDALFNARPLIEDAWYALTVARWLARGAGFSADGMQPTNGVQPLIVLFDAPLFAFFGDAVAVRLALAVCMVIEAALAWMLYATVRDMARDRMRGARAGTIAALLLLWSPSALVSTLNGLETGLAALAALVIVRLWMRTEDAVRHRDPGPLHAAPLPAEASALRIGLDAAVLRRALAAGVAAGLGVLARIDLAFLVVVLTLLAFARVLRPMQADALSRRTERQRVFAQVLITGATALAVSAPWWIYNVSTFGHLTPTSGLSQRLAIPLAENFTALVQALLNALLVIGYVPYSPSLPIAHRTMLVALAVAGVVVAAVPPLRRSLAAGMRALRAGWRGRGLLPLGMFVAALACYYVLDFGAPHFLQRYLFLLRILAFIGAGIAVEEFRMRFSPVRRRIVAVAGVAVTAGVFGFWYAWNFSPAKAAENDFLAVSEWVRAQVPAGDRVGMGQSGTAGFFNAQVVNLDGKVNAAVFEAMRAQRFCAFVDSARYEWLADWPHFFARLDSCGVMRQYVLVDSVGRFRVYRRKPDVK
jgi:hypothetical protein